MNDEAVYRTAPATPGLLNIYIYCNGLVGPLIRNCPNQVNKNLILCAKVSKNMICNLILISNFSKKMILYTNYLPNVTENLGSNLEWVAQLIYNVEMKLLPQM